MLENLKKIIYEGIIRDIDFIERQVETNFPDNKIITITGPRRSGKTFFMFQIMDRYLKKGYKRNQFLYINFEDERISEKDFDYDNIFQAYYELFPENIDKEIIIFFDEIQLLKNWEKFIRRVYDFKTRKLFLTGSNSEMLSSDISTSLRGRNYNIELLPLSFIEFLKFKSFKNLLITPEHKALVENYFQEYLVYGGYPEIVNYEEPIKIEILQNYFNVMIYRDIVERFNYSDPEQLKYILKRLISTVSSEFSINKLYNEIKSQGGKISKQSIYSLYDDVSNIYLFKTVEKYSFSLSERRSHNKKVYFYDTGILSAVNYSLSEDYGKLLENLVACELLRKKFDLFYIKNSNECDFIAKNREQKIAVQVCYELNEDNIQREMKALNDIKDVDKKILIYRFSKVTNPLEAISILDFLGVRSSIVD
ncbi:MAG: ATP-binding protein [Candidatus Muiribacteriota bacterium]